MVDRFCQSEVDCIKEEILLQKSRFSSGEKQALLTHSHRCIHATLHFFAKMEPIPPLAIVPEGPATGRSVSPAERFSVVTIDGYKLRVGAFYYLRLSRKMHVYLTRYGGRVFLHIREFHLDQDNSNAIPTIRDITMDKQQTRDFLHFLPSLHDVVMRDDIIRVSNFFFLYLYKLKRS